MAAAAPMGASVDQAALSIDDEKEGLRFGCAVDRMKRGLRRLPTMVRCGEDIAAEPL